MTGCSLKSPRLLWGKLELRFKRQLRLRRLKCWGQVPLLDGLRLLLDMEWHWL